MENTTDLRSTAVLLARRTLARHATQGQWEAVITREEDGTLIGCSLFSLSPDSSKSICCSLTCTEEDEATMQYLASCSPETILADLDELIALRSKVAVLQKQVAGTR